MKGVPTVTTGATPLAAMKFDHQPTANLDLALGTVSGSLGETSAALILLGGAYLAWRKMLDWKIPVGILATVFLLSGLFYLIDRSYPPPLFMLLSGGLMLGAVYMATDMVTSPVTVIIRIWGGLPEGVMYAILLANGLTPLINWYTQPRIYGARKKS
jgi:electron transport complex protein RnfD